MNQINADLVDSNVSKYISQFDELIENHDVGVYLSSNKRGDNYFKIITDLLLSDLRKYVTPTDKILYLETITRYNNEKMIEVINHIRECERVIKEYKESDLDWLSFSEKKLKGKKLFEYLNSKKYSEYSIIQDEYLFLGKILENIFSISSLIQNQIEIIKSDKIDSKQAQPSNSIKQKMGKKLKKIQFNATYESIERIIQLLISAGFINPENGNNMGEILSNTSQKWNKKRNQYEDILNTDFNSSRSQFRDKKGIIKNINSKPVSNKKGNEDKEKFEKLLNELKKIIPPKKD